MEDRQKLFAYARKRIDKFFVKKRKEKEMNQDNINRTYSQKCAHNKFDIS